MVQRSVPQQGKMQKVAERTSGAAVRPRGNPSGEECRVAPQKPRPQHIIPQTLLRQYDEILLVDRSSGTMKLYAVTASEPEPKEVKLHDYLGAAESPNRRLLVNEPLSRKRRSSHSSSPEYKRRKPRLEPDETEDDDDYVSDAEDELDGVLEGLEGDAYYSQPIKVCELEKYFLTAFKMVGQLGCKDIGKAWIKTGHPKKQTTHPYNGGKLKERSKRLYGHPGALTRPDYWPCIDGWEDGLGCRHQEPDHIKKPERLILLMHLLRCGHSKFTVENLEKGTAQIEREIPRNFTTQSIKILRQIYFARSQEIRYQEGEIDGDTVINLCVPKPSNKAPKAAKTSPASSVKDEPPQQASETSTSTEANAEMDLDVPTINGDFIDAQIDPDSAEDVKPIMLRTTSGSTTMSNVVAQRFSPQTRGPLGQNGVTETGPRASIPTQGQWYPQSSFSRRPTPSHAVPNAFAGHPNEHTQYPLQYPGPVAHPGNPDMQPDLRQQQAATQYQGEHHQMTTPHGLHQQPQPSSYVGKYPMSLPCRPAAPKAMTFAGSSSGLAGLPSDSSWMVNNNPSSMRQFGSTGSIYTNGADPNALLTSYPSDITSSFGSDYPDTSFGNGLQMSHPSGPSRAQTERQAIDTEFRQQYPTYLTSNFNTLSLQPGTTDYVSSFPVDYSMSMDAKFIPYDQEARFM